MLKGGGSLVHRIFTRFVAQHSRLGAKQMQNKLISNVIRIGYTGLHVYAIKKLQNKPIMWPNQLIKESTRFSILRRSSILMLDSNNFISSSQNANFRIKQYDICLFDYSETHCLVWTYIFVDSNHRITFLYDQENPSSLDN